MCGITGFVGTGNGDDLRRMTARLHHRGPDGTGFWEDPARGIYLGHQRLAILDIPGGAQPMWTEDRMLAIVFNGEIYNHAELRTALAAKGHRFLTDHSDTETLLLGYREWGPDLQRRLNGMWAFAILDLAHGLLFCSRDRFGQKPFFYSARPGLFAFASELSGLTQHTRISPDFEPMSLKKYFAYGYIPAPNSLYRNIFKLPGGQSLTLDLTTGKHRIERYWRFELERDHRLETRPGSELAEELRELLDRAVKRRLMADVPVGVFLSGGIDSSAVAHFASGHTNPGELRTFTVGFPDKSFDESAYAGAIATHLGTRHRVQRFSWSEAQAAMPRIAGDLDEPMGDGSLVPCYLLGQFAARHVKVVLGGDGADELFAGYDPFRALHRAEIYRRLIPKPIHRGIRLLASRIPVSHRNISLDFKIKRTLRGLDYPAKLWLPTWMGPLDHGELEQLFGEAIDPEALYEEAIDSWERCPSKNIVDRTLTFFTDLYLSDGILVKIDRANMLHGLEVRSPFLDIDLVDFVRRLPTRYKLHHGRTKVLLKRAMLPLLPPTTVARPKKGFGMPVGLWFKQGKIPLGPQPYQGLRKEYVDRILDEHRRGRADHRLFLWSYWLLSGHRHRPGNQALQWTTGQLTGQGQ